MQEGIGGDVGADFFEVRSSPFCLPPTQRLTAGTLWPLRDHGVGEIELPVKFERAGMDGERARGRPAAAVLSTMRTFLPRVS